MNITRISPRNSVLSPKSPRQTAWSTGFAKHKSVQRLKPRNQAWISPESTRETASFHQNHPDKQRGRVDLRNIKPCEPSVSLDYQLSHDITLHPHAWRDHPDIHPTIEPQSRISVAVSFVGSNRTKHTVVCAKTIEAWDEEIIYTRSSQGEVKCCLS